MCGIGGVVTGRPESPAALSSIAERMAGVLAHRGPDGAGIWTDPGAGVAIGHRRLAIIDLGPTGAQPAVSADGRYVLAYNGEIYNAPELADELRARGVSFRGHSDTEVLVEACASWGAARAIERLNGMFAFALWDCRERSLLLARDRLGIKPMYWAHRDGQLLFGSELKAIEAHGGWSYRIDRAALAAYLGYGYVPAPASIYENVFKLEPGCTLSWRAGSAPRIERYWDLPAIAYDGMRRRLELSEEDAAEELEFLLADSVRRHMLADVPVGCLLSGGINSSLVTMLAQEAEGRRVRTFSVGFRKSAYDETAQAREVARLLGTEHTEIRVDAASALDVIPRLSDIYDEPFADSSQIPTRIVAHLARQHVKVALSGDGGDELFGGYNRYFWSQTIQRTMRFVPLPMRQAAAALCRQAPERFFGACAALMPRAIRPVRLYEKSQKLSEILMLADGDDVYRRLITQWPDPGATAGAEPAAGRIVGAGGNSIERMQILDTITYLPDDILTKVDRASMSVGLEARVPFLDHRVVAYAWRLPPSYKIRGRRGKLPLRRLLYRRLPPELVDRPKQGFAIPLAEWLRGPLRPWAEELLSERRLREAGLFETATIRARWAQNLAGTRNWSYAIWTVLMLMAWFDRHRTVAHAA